MKIFVRMAVNAAPDKYRVQEVEADEVRSPWKGYRLFLHEAPDKEGLYNITEWGSGLTVVRYETSKIKALEGLKNVYKNKMQIFEDCVKACVEKIGVANDELF